MLLLGRRRSAALCVGMSSYWPGGLLAHPAFVRAAAFAPSAHEVYWPNLVRPSWRLRLNRLVGIGLTAALFLFWTVPVGAVQALSSASSLAAVPGFAWLAAYLQRAGPEAAGW